MSTHETKNYEQNPRKRLLTAATSFMGKAIHESLLEITSLTDLRSPKSIEELSAQLSYAPEPLRRFMDAATSLNFTARSSTHRYSINSDTPVVSSETANALFWLIRSDLPRILSNSARPVAELSRDGGADTQVEAHLSALIKAGILDRQGEAVRISEDVRPFLNPESSSYMGLWLENYEKVMARIFCRKGVIGALKTGRTQWPEIFGTKVTNPFDFAKTDPGLFRTLMEGMHQANAFENSSVASFVRTNGSREVLDIGGASGALAMALLDAHPSIAHVEIYELAEAVPLYRELFARYSGSKRYPIQFTEGNFFLGDAKSGLWALEPSKTFDLITLGWILHDWPDEECLTLLRRAVKHLRPRGRLVLLEAVLPEDRLGPATLLDMTMLLQTGGKERTLSEYRSLLADTGLRLTNVQSTETRRQVIEFELIEGIR
jgi:SAM-dependent methyltransferase